MADYERDFKGVWIPKEIWLNNDLTIMEKVFLVEIDSLDNEDGCYASNKHFSEFFQLSKGRCSQIINSLKEKGYIKISYKRKDNQIEKRTIRVVNKLNTPIKYIKGGIKYSKGGYLENAKENNTLYNNTINNNNIDEQSSSMNMVKEIIAYLNEKTGKQFKHSGKKNQRLIKARLNEGYEVDDFKKVIDIKVNDWKDNPDFNKYLRPETLFGTKFEGYLNQDSNVSSSDTSDTSLSKEEKEAFFNSFFG